METGCSSGASIGSIGSYAVGGGEATADAAIGFLAREVGREWGLSSQPQTVASSDTKVIVEYSDESMVIARGAVTLVDGRWRTEGLSQYARHVATTDEGGPQQD